MTKVYEGVMRVGYPDDCYYEGGLYLDGYNFGYELDRLLGGLPMAATLPRDHQSRGMMMTEGRRVKITVEFLDDV